MDLNMPTKITIQDDGTEQVQQDEETVFKTWSDGAGLEDASSSDDDSVGALQSKMRSKTLLKHDNKDDDEDEEYEATASQAEDEKDVTFEVEDYVDKVQMKREEDALEKEKELKAKQVAKQKGSKGGKVQTTLKITTGAPNANKRQTDDRSPQAQTAGAATKTDPQR